MKVVNLKTVCFLLLALIVSGLAFAQEESPAATELSFADALARAAQVDADVITARVDLESAERDLARVRQDPLALRIPILQAEQAVQQARQALDISILSAQSDVANAYASAKEADTALLLAQAQQGISQTQFDATNIRFNAGAATSLDVDRARNTLESSQRDTADANQSRVLAYDQLASLVGLPNNLVLTDIVPASEIPALETIIANLSSNSSITRNRHALDLSQAQLAAIDNAFSARSDIDAARDSVSNAQTRLNDGLRSLEISIRQTYNGVLAAQSRVANASANLTTSQEDLNAQQVRYDAGSISLLELEQSKLSIMNSRSQLETAQHALASSVRQLELAVKGGF